MSHEDLVQAIETLRRELDETDHLDETEVEKLHATIDEIESTIEAKSEHAVTLSERFSQSAKEFEASHPVLTMNLGRVADILQRMGF